MIPVIFNLEDWEGWTVERNMERNVLSVPRTGEMIHYKDSHFKVRKVTYDLDCGSLTPVIKIYAKTGD
ncbi:hypothetical protein D3C87_482400 [compost metagenome]